ncbi:MAG TPA: hypothetical protein VGR76_05200 [Candidatus Angelobacter sp.]|jgi:hypothetical protein|nr:hypothetical protein [Candidatus Angelobacter sp.]
MNNGLQNNELQNNDLQFDSLIKRMAAEHRPELPSPDVIWWRAQILKKQAEKRRIERPVTIMRIAAAALLLLVVVWLWTIEADSMRDAWGRLGVSPFLPLLLAGAVMGLVVMALIWQTKSEV